MFQLITKFWQAWRFALLLIYDRIASEKYFVKLQVSMNTSDLSGGELKEVYPGGRRPQVQICTLMYSLLVFHWR